MIAILLASLLACPKPIIEIRTKEPWSTQDQAAQERAVLVCRERYMACLKRFVRESPGRYQAVCKKLEKK